MDIPAPDVTHQPRFVPELSLVEIIYSPDNHARVVIAKDRRNLYHLHPERWDVSDLTVIGHGTWCSWGYQNSMTDDIDIARQLAREVLPTIPPPEVSPE